MAGDVQYVLTLGNSIIGVSVLAMPYCFQQCGIILSMLLLIGINLVTRVACHLLLKSAILCRRRNYEQLAFASFGAGGKLAVELGLIGFLVGTCVAFFVVIGDLGPAIVSRSFTVENSSSLRSFVMLALAFFVILPLCLLRNIESLTGIAILSFLFYFILVLKVFFASVGHLWSDGWMGRVALWEPSGMLVCIPIFSMALSCQTQIFEIYESMPDPTLHKMNSVVSGAVNMCTFVYAAVGLFGYLTFYDLETGVTGIPGNVLMIFPQTAVTEGIKFFYVLSVALSFPLVLFPCRASIHSLLYPPTQHAASHDVSSLYIPDSRFKGITVVVVVASLGMGIVLPAIEVVLSLMGSTIGLIVCLIFPATIFIKNTSKNTNERTLAQVILCIGIFLMVAGTYTNLVQMDSNRSLELGIDKGPVQRLEISKESLSKIENQPVALKPPVPSNATFSKKPPVSPKADSPKVLDQTKNNSSKVEKPSRSTKKKKKKSREGTGNALNDVKPNQLPSDDSFLRGVENAGKPAIIIQSKEEKIIHQLAEEQQEQRQILDEQRKLIEDLRESKVKLNEEAKKAAQPIVEKSKAEVISELETKIKEISDLKKKIEGVGGDKEEIQAEVAAVLAPAPEEPAKQPPNASAFKASKLQEPYVLTKLSDGSPNKPESEANGGEVLEVKRDIVAGEIPKEENCPVPGDCPAVKEAVDSNKDRGL
ncbi:unnamed protein product [Notodromas monacha]|uniref:Amino acid transporter transmembrane domain-containing protein n=1 Tax=Notodromas monacha TaxID=399045 RepID=A0A7R9GBG1_9CRUS|nr:unnamed protein product [Notodromas monacha]CAG0916322.1 unnamed protein product [Notodromas monacha]